MRVADPSKDTGHATRSILVFQRDLGCQRPGLLVAPPREMGWFTHEEIGAWQRAEELCTLVRGICQRSSFDRDDRLRNQLLDAGRSGPRNIAEGFGRWRHADFAKFVRIAKASEVELLNHFNEAFKSRHITQAERDKLDHAAKKAIKAANGLIRWLENSPDP